MTQKIEFTAEEDRQLDELIDKFKSDDEYYAHIQRQTVSHILRTKGCNQRPTAEERLISIVISNRY
jgi:hypothetical protein